MARGPCANLSCCGHGCGVPTHCDCSACSQAHRARRGGQGLVPSWASGAACIWHIIHRRIGYGPHQRCCVLFRPASPWPWPHKSFCPSAYANICGDSLQDGIFRLIWFFLCVFYFLCNSILVWTSSILGTHLFCFIEVYCTLYLYLVFIFFACVHGSRVLFLHGYNMRTA